MARIPYLYKKLISVGVPADIASQVADTDYEGTVTTSLGDLADVDLTTPAEDDALTYDGTNWVNTAP